MASALRTHEHPKGLFSDHRRFIQSKQPEVAREFESLIKDFPLLQADRLLHEAVCRLVNNKALQHVLAGYRQELGLMLDTYDFPRATIFMRSVSTKRSGQGTVELDHDALDRRTDYRNVPNSLEKAHRIALWFYKRLITYCYVTIRDLKRHNWRRTIVPGPPAGMKAAPAAPRERRPNPARLRLVVG